MKNAKSLLGQAPEPCSVFDSVRPMAPSRRAVLRSGAAWAGVCVPWASIAAEDDALASTQTWTDAARTRDVPVLLRWPQGKPQGVVIYSHGLGGKKEGGDVWGKAWAAAGMLVVHLQHAGSDAAALRGGWSALRKAMQPEQLVARVADVRFVIAELQRRRASAERQWASIPTDRLAVAGHSFGARSTLVAAGWQRSGWSSPEPQVKAFVAFSPALGQVTDLAQARRELASVTRPFLVCSGSLDGEVLGNGETPESRRMVFEALPAGKKAMLWLDQADHFTFAGNDKQIPSSFLARRSKASLEREDAQHALVAQVSAMWLREQLGSEPMPAVKGLGPADQWIRA